MGSEGIDKRISPPAVVAAAAVAVTLKQAMEGVDPANGFSLVLGAGMVLGYLAWARRQDAPGHAPGTMARVPATGAIVVGLFCLLHWFVACLVLAIGFSVASKKARARDGATERPLSQVLGELLIVDAAPGPAARPPVSREAAPVAPRKSATTRSLQVERPVAPPAPVLPVAAVEAEAEAPLAPTGFSMPMTSVLDSRGSFVLESRIPLVLESRLSALTGSLGTSGGSSGFDEALALLQSKPTSTDRAD